MKKDLTIIICTLNEEKNIGILLDNLYQKIDHYEILLIDADSEDNTRNIANLFPEIKVFNQGKIGLLFQRMFAISITKTEFFSFIDADDLIEPQNIIDALQYLKQNKLDGIQFKTTSRVINDNFWQNVWASYFKTIYVDNENIDMLGRPCISKTIFYNELNAFKLDSVPTIIEDTYLHKVILNKFGKLKYKVAPFYSYRLCEDNMVENWKKWVSYGKGDAQITTSLQSFINSFWHLFFRILLKRTIKTALSRSYYYTPGILFFSLGRLAGFIYNLAKKPFTN